MTHGRRQLRLRIHDRVVFVDWHGVLSTQLFWQSVTDRGRHPLRETVAREVGRMFKSEVAFVREWMRGAIGAQDFVSRLRVGLPRNYRPDFLYRRLHEEIRDMALNQAVADLVRPLRSQAFVVLATDNMDCFAAEWMRNEQIAGLVDDVLCSASIGVLKKEDWRRFFGGWLGEHGLEMREAVLVDDCRETCEVFERAGGRALYFTNADQLRDELRAEGFSV